MDRRTVDTDGGDLVAAGGVCPSWLPHQALELLSSSARRAWSPGSVPRPPVPPDALRRLEAGVATLAAALGVPGLPDGGPDADPDHLLRRARAALRRAAELTAAAGEAARHLAWAAAMLDHEPAAEAADTVMTAALTLRILSEIELHAVPPAGATDVRGR